MARLRTDWILFLTIVAMVFFGLVMLYSASSAVAELRYHVAPYYFEVRQIGWAVVSFVVLDLVTPKVAVWKEICEKQNLALAIFLGAIAIGMAIIIASAIHG